MRAFISSQFNGTGAGRAEDFKCNEDSTRTLVMNMVGYECWSGTWEEIAPCPQQNCVHHAPKCVVRDTYPTVNFIALYIDYQCFS